MFGGSLKGRMFGSLLGHDDVGIKRLSFQEATAALSQAELCEASAARVQGGFSAPTPPDVGQPEERRGAASR